MSASRVLSGQLQEGTTMTRWCAVAVGAVLGLNSAAAGAGPLIPNSPEELAEARRLANEPPIGPPPANKVIVDHSGRKQIGKGSFYGPEFAGKQMANGERFNPRSDVAASKSLPLGTIARVTNQRNGRSATVKVEDRGPYVSGRVVDLTPKIAEQLGMTREGVVPVVVAPVAVPQPDGSVKVGAGAADLTDTEVAESPNQGRK
jgi:rare lipoprotein A